MSKETCDICEKEKENLYSLELPTEIEDIYAIVSACEDCIDKITKSVEEAQEEIMLRKAQKFEEEKEV